MSKTTKPFEIKTYDDSIIAINCDLCNTDITDQKINSLIKATSVVRENLMGRNVIENIDFGKTFHLCDKCCGKILAMLGNGE